jgi:8-amino-7-oxononanoate synthase
LTDLINRFEANVTLFSTIPAEDDAIIYDELIHASVHDGMKLSKSKTKLSFLHNDLDSFRETLKGLSSANEKLRKGENSVIIAVETVYSMEGDLAPLKELVQIAKEEFPLGNASFAVDEAHATGLFGLNGRGLVAHLGLEDEIAIRMHTMGKAIASTGGTYYTSFILI